MAAASSPTMATTGLTVRAGAIKCSRTKVRRKTGEQNSQPLPTAITTARPVKIQIWSSDQNSRVRTVAPAIVMSRRTVI